jgi:hypothetical protein
VALRSIAAVAIVARQNCISIVRGLRLIYQDVKDFSVKMLGGLVLVFVDEALGLLIMR